MNQKKNNILKYGVLVSIIVILTLFIYFEYFVMQRYFEQNIKNEQKLIGKVFKQKIKDIEHIYEKRLENLLSVPEIKEGIINKNIDLLKKYFIPMFDKIQKENKFVKTMLITDTNSIVVLRAHRPEMNNDDLSVVRPIIKKANELKKNLFGFEAGKMSIPYRITIPIIYEGVHYGVLDMGISSNFFIEYINKIASSAHATSLLNKDFLKNFIKNTYLNKTPIKKGFLAPNFNEFFEPFFDSIDLNKEISQVEKEGRIYLINSTFKMTSFNNTSFGTILIAYDITDIVNEQWKNIFKTFVLTGLIILIVFLLLRYYEKETEKVSQKIIEQKTYEYKGAMQKAQAANIAKSEFLANMSHEIRTPLNAIMGFIDLLKEDEENKDKLKYLNIIGNSSYNLLDIINDILDFSKIESNQINIESRVFNPLDELESVSELFKARILEKNLIFKVDIDKNLPKHINSDSLRIKQVITNLLSNALKFTDENKTVSFKVKYIDEKLSVNIKDEGIGIDPKKIKTIFKPFTQADNSTTRKYGGTGLGLTISSRLVKALGGELKVKSELGKGSEFYFTIPVKEIESQTQEGIIQTHKKLSGHILLVEDNKANQMFMKVILKKIGLTFDIANNGLEAIERFPKIICDCGKTKYDAILMDENMPNMNGMEATKKILELEKQLNLPHTPIIALTANALKGDRERFLEIGMDEYLTKPANKSKLINVLEKYL
ncbi:response regulator [Sulfurimonas lithotrophica]|uniref:histidine kinase n=1 Tax=Sulfurimonas lithotrophica TaxID=2590022 RepID=A0A5P8P134_9BACT|nr:ATP-binding protein [Sulfurimonas lithotrophica]QFR49311.1 response regulator [Sulfurimonas lithotrophica]